MNKGGPRHGKGNLEKPKNFKKSMLQLFNYIKPYIPIFIIAIVLSIVSAVFTIIGPSKISDITNEIVKGFSSSINMNKVNKIALFLAIIYTMSSLFAYIENYIMASFTNKFSMKLRNEISHKINKLPLKYYDKNSYGDILSRVTNDVDTLGHTLNQTVGNLVMAIVLLIGVIIMMFITNSIMATASIITTLIGFALLSLILSKSQKYFTEQQEQLGQINGHIEEVYSGHNVVVAYNGVKDANKKFDKINEKLYKSARKSQFISGLMQPIMGFVGNFSYVVVCIIGAMLVIDNKASLGTIVSFMIYIRLFNNPLMTLAQSATQLQTTAAASERIFSFLNEKEMNIETTKKKKINPKKVIGNIEFNNVMFGYEKDKIIINDFNFKASSGQKIAIVGPTGAGKTTIVNLLMKFYEIHSGDIKIDGVSINDITRENVHDLFVMVLQDTWLFEGTIKENIIYNKDNITDEQVKNACKTVGIDHFIKTLPKGYDTVLSDAENISAGQKQLMTIARANIENKPFLILDEATSSVDTRTEELVQKAMDKLTEGKTSFIIAHRLSTIKNADLILVMNNGNIIEQGNHEELIKENGFYADLYNSQFQN